MILRWLLPSRRPDLTLATAEFTAEDLKSGNIVKIEDLDGTMRFPVDTHWEWAKLKSRPAAFTKGSTFLPIPCACYYHLDTHFPEPLRLFSIRRTPINPNWRVLS